jgi:hypothetical protein
MMMMMMMDPDLSATCRSTSQLDLATLTTSLPPQPATSYLA